MKINPFEIGKMVNNAIKNRDRYKTKVEQLKSKPLEVTVGNATAIYDIDQNRINQIRAAGINKEELENNRLAVNQVFDQADEVWSEFEK